MMPKVGIVYLSYNSLPYLDEVFASWDQLEYPREQLEIIVVDNASSDGSQEYLRVAKGITYLENETNTGFAEGNNKGIEQAMARGAEYVFLHNNDLKLAPDALLRAVELAESDPTIGSVQSLVLLWQDPERVNVSGGMVHFLGLGYARHNGMRLVDALPALQEGEEIAYASGAAVLLRTKVLQQIGLLDPFLFLYHEDLDLGWRIRLAGSTNRLCVASRAYHHYEFKRSVKKFFWMERNRWLVHLAHLRLRSLLVLIPLMVLFELPLLVFAVRGGWLKEKFLVYRALLDPRTWRYLATKRRASQSSRQVSDKNIVRLFTSVIEHQETQSVLVTRVGNPLLSFVWRVLKPLIK